MMKAPPPKTSSSGTEPEDPFLRPNAASYQFNRSSIIKMAPPEVWDNIIATFMTLIANVRRAQAVLGEQYKPNTMVNAGDAAAALRVQNDASAGK